MNKNNPSKPIYLLFALIALVVIIDFTFPGRKITNNIVSILSERQTYFNAGGNSHLSYEVTTNERTFSVSEDFAHIELKGESIEYSVSIIFNEVNWYQLLNAGGKHYYSLRVVSGLVLPLFVIISMLIAVRFKKNWGVFIFVLQALLLADLIFLIR